MEEKKFSLASLSVKLPLFLVLFCIILSVGNGIIGLGSATVDLRPLTEEEAQEFRDLTDKVSNISNEDRKLMEIINDECKAYYAGDKSLDETVRIIQDRAQIYMNESR